MLYTTLEEVIEKNRFGEEARRAALAEKQARAAGEIVARLEIELPKKVVEDFKDSEDFTDAAFVLKISKRFRRSC